MMLLPIPVPVALACPAYLIDDDADLKGMPLADVHKEVLAMLKKAGYKRTRVEEDDLVLLGSAIEVDLLSPDGKEKISLTFNTEDDSWVERETLVPETKAEAYARYRPLLKEKFPSIELVCHEYGPKTYAAAHIDLSEATPKRVTEAIAETKKAIALIEANRGAAGSAPAPTSAEKQKSVLAAFQKAGFQSGKAEAIPGTIGNSVEIPLTRAGERFVLTFNELYTKIGRILSRTDISAAERAKYVSLLKEKSLKADARFEAQGLTLELLESIDDATPTRLMAMLEEVQRAAKLLPDAGSSAPTPAPAGEMGATLKQSGLIFKDIGDFYSLGYDFADTKRSQAAYIRKRVDNYNSLKIHEIFSIFYDAKDAPSAELLQKVFQKRFSIGGLVLEAPNASQSNWRIRFRIDAPADIATDRLKKYVRLVAGTADSLEKELFSEDKVH
jgi:hypothetical protein